MRCSGAWSALWNESLANIITVGTWHWTYVAYRLWWKATDCHFSSLIGTYMYVTTHTFVTAGTLVGIWQHFGMGSATLCWGLSSIVGGRNFVVKIRLRLKVPPMISLSRVLKLWPLNKSLTREEQSMHRFIHYKIGTKWEKYVYSLSNLTCSSSLQCKKHVLSHAWNTLQLAVYQAYSEGFHCKYKTE